MTEYYCVPAMTLNPQGMHVRPSARLAEFGNKTPGIVIQANGLTANCNALEIMILAINYETEAYICVPTTYSDCKDIAVRIKSTCFESCDEGSKPSLKQRTLTWEGIREGLPLNNPLVTDQF